MIYLILKMDRSLYFILWKMINLFLNLFIIVELNEQIYAHTIIFHYNFEFVIKNYFPF